jgi:hypothetical protein
MQSKQQRYEVFVKVREFGRKHQSRFPVASTAGQAFAIVAEAAAAIERQRARKEVSSLSGRKDRAEARRDLWNALTVIARTAREAKRTALATDAKFELPRRRSDAALFQAGKDFVSMGETKAHEWVPLGLPETAVADLSRLLARFEKAVVGRREAMADAKKARKSLDKAFVRGFDAVRRLDTIVANTLEHDDELLVEWADCRRVTFRRRSSAPVDMTPAVTPAVVPATPEEASPPEAAGPAPTSDAGSAATVVKIDDVLRKVS